MAAITVTPLVAAQAQPQRTWTIAGTAFTAASGFLVNVQDPNGAQTAIPLTTTGGGGFSFTYVPQDVGTLTVKAYPLTSVGVPVAIPNVASLGAATATGTGTVVHGDM